MGKKSKLNLIGIVKSLIQVYLQRVTDITTLAGLEARLATKTLITIIVFGCVMALFLISTWFSLLLLLFVYLISHFTYLISSLIIVAINISFLIATYFYILKIKKNLFFPATRKQLANLRGKD